MDGLTLENVMNNYWRKATNRANKKKVGEYVTYHKRAWVVTDVPDDIHGYIGLHRPCTRSATGWTHAYCMHKTAKTIHIPHAIVVYLAEIQRNCIVTVHDAVLLLGRTGNQRKMTVAELRQDWTQLALTRYKEQR